MDIVIVRAAQPIKAGQVVRTTGSPATPTPPTVKPITVTVPAVEELHTIPFFGVALEPAKRAGDDVKVQIGGAFSGRLGRGKFGAVGVNSSGQIVRAADEIDKCVSAPNWIGDCDDSGTVTIRPRRDTRLSVLDFGAVGNNKDDDTGAIQSALDCAMRLGTTHGKVVYLPPGDYRITKPLVVKHHCILEGAGGAGLGVTENTRILADVKRGDFNLSTATGIGPVAGETVYCAIALVGSWTSGPPTQDPSNDRADYAVLRQFTLKSDPDQGKFAPTFYQAPQMDGIRVLAHGPLIETVGVSVFRRNGMTIYASHGPDFGPTANANLTQIRDCILANNGQHGLDIGSHGNDETNAMLVMNVSAATNGRDGIHDNSFLGCTFVSCHAAHNRHRQYGCDHEAPQFAVYIGCYGEGDAPSVFKGGNIAVVGGDMIITSDSTYWGYGAVKKGPSTLKVTNKYSKYPEYFISEAGTGVDIEEGEQQTPGNGYYYRAVHAGHTFGKNGKPPDGMPDFPKGVGQTLEELDHLVWRCEGKYRIEFSTVNKLGDASDSTIIQDYGSLAPDDQWSALFRVQVQTAPDVIKGRIETSLVKPDDHHTYYQTAYENGPVPGALMLPEAWIGNYLFGERRIAIVHDGTPWNTAAGSCNFYGPGDLLLNATGATARQGPIGWAVNAPCGRRSAALAWSDGKHYKIGQTVKPASANGFVYRLISYIGGPSDELLRVSDVKEPPSWQQPGPGRSVGGLTSDNHLQWQTIYDLDANPGIIEPLPHGVTGQADSRAMDFDHLKADFNALLAKMRDANLLERN